MANGQAHCVEKVGDTQQIVMATVRRKPMVLEYLIEGEMQCETQANGIENPIAGNGQHEMGTNGIVNQV